MTTSALKVKAINLDTQIVDVLASLLPHVKLGANIQKIATVVTPHTHGKHHPHAVILASRLDTLFELFGVEVRWEVFNQYFSFCH